MSIRKFVYTSLLAAMSWTSAASAATLTGDQVAITFQPENLVILAFVGTGVDKTFGLFEFDFNAGAAGDEFVFNDNNGSFGSNTSIVLSGLDFPGSSILTGFELLSTRLENLAFTFTDTSLTFTFVDIAANVPDGPAIRGRFLTEPVAAVPLPASLPLMLAGLGAVAILRRRKK